MGTCSPDLSLLMDADAFVTAVPLGRFNPAKHNAAVPEERMKITGAFPAEPRNGKEVDPYVSPFSWPHQLMEHKAGAVHGAGFQQQEAQQSSIPSAHQQQISDSEHRSSDTVLPHPMSQDTTPELQLGTTTGVNNTCIDQHLRSSSAFACQQHQAPGLPSEQELPNVSAMHGHVPQVLGSRNPCNEQQQAADGSPTHSHSAADRHSRSQQGHSPQKAPPGVPVPASVDTPFANFQPFGAPDMPSGFISPARGHNHMPHMYGTVPAPTSSMPPIGSGHIPAMAPSAPHMPPSIQQYGYSYGPGMMPCPGMDTYAQGMPHMAPPGYPSGPCPAPHPLNPMYSQHSASSQWHWQDGSSSSPRRAGMRTSAGPGMQLAGGSMPVPVSMPPATSSPTKPAPGDGPALMTALSPDRSMQHAGPMSPGHMHGRSMHAAAGMAGIGSITSPHRLSKCQGAGDAPAGSQPRIPPAAVQPSAGAPPDGGSGGGAAGQQHQQQPRGTGTRFSESDVAAHSHTNLPDHSESQSRERPLPHQATYSQQMYPMQPGGHHTAYAPHPYGSSSYGFPPYLEGQAIYGNGMVPPHARSVRAKRSLHHTHSMPLPSAAAPTGQTPALPAACDAGAGGNHAEARASSTFERSSSVAAAPDSSTHRAQAPPPAALQGLPLMSPDNSNKSAPAALDPDKPDEGWMAANMCYKRFASDPFPVPIPPAMASALLMDMRRIHAALLQRKASRQASGALLPPPAAAVAATGAAAVPGASAPQQEQPQPSSGGADQAAALKAVGDSAHGEPSARSPPRHSQSMPGLPAAGEAADAAASAQAWQEQAHQQQPLPPAAAAVARDGPAASTATAGGFSSQRMVACSRALEPLLPTPCFAVGAHSVTAAGVPPPAVSAAAARAAALLSASAGIKPNPFMQHQAAAAGAIGAGGGAFALARCSSTPAGTLTSSSSLKRSREGAAAAAAAATSQGCPQ